MSLLPSILVLLLMNGARAFNDCKDCTRIDLCEPAIQLVKLDRSATTVTLLRNAYCGYDSLPKVCCSDFTISRAIIQNETNDVPASPAEHEIANHTNINLLSGECGDVEGNRIVGGVNASLYEFPWLALIAYKVADSVTFSCGGTVINSRYILTAAHCVKNKKIAGVRIGDYDISSKVDCIGEGENRECESMYQDIGISQAFYHQDYVRMPQVVNDIALIRLAKPVDFSFRNAAPICLPVTKQLLEMDIAGERGVVAGWGVTEEQRRSNILLKVEIPIYSLSVCNTFYNRNGRINNLPLTNVFCAGELGRDSCKGDSGGPIMLEGPYRDTYKLIQFGVVSYGPSQCGSTIPGVYTDVRKFMKWILDNIKP
ncbi:CLIP domain-containing serine protease HP8-like [Battus philenor]|uniref:CLIP domain-containing serine protease HP8-like n=1 Tax=Battus philenor TaxID=42288 RepID=UPI0035D0C9F2